MASERICLVCAGHGIRPFQASIQPELHNKASQPSFQLMDLQAPTSSISISASQHAVSFAIKIKKIILGKGSPLFVRELPHPCWGFFNSMEGDCTPPYPPASHSSPSTGRCVLRGFYKAIVPYVVHHFFAGICLFDVSIPSRRPKLVPNIFALSSSVIGG